MDLELTPYALDEDAGYRRPRGSSSAHLLEADRLMQAAWHGTTLRARADFQEAMASSDLRNAAFEILDRETLERYEAMPAVWSGYARLSLTRDFKKKRIVDLIGGRGALDPVPELTPYPERNIGKSLYELQVAKFGARFAFSWESWVNDELEELESLPEALAIAARETESRVAATLLTDGTGPNDLFFKTGYTSFQNADGSPGSNLMVGNPELSLQSLQNAAAQITSRRNDEGRPVVFPMLTLVVPPSLEIQARTVLGAMTVETQEGTGNTAGSRRVMAPNVIAGMFRIVVEPFLSVIDKGPNAAKTWYVVPDPGTGRVALALGKLRGHEQPQVRVKSGQGMLVGGGALAPNEGTFEIDDIQYRVRHVLGSTYVDPIGTLASTGANA